MRRRFGLGNPNVVHYPHFSYHIAGDYDMARLEQVLARFAAETATFTVHASGLGIFTGPEPVLYVPVARNPTLTTLHQALWPEIERAGRHASAYYAPDVWLPHITLGHGDITPDDFTVIVPWLNEQRFHWHITVNNLGLIYDTGTGHTLRARFDFKP
jgi:2'-5' RNA ligase